MQHLLDASIQNPTALRYFIQYEVLQKKPIYESYKTFCKAIGNGTMSYSEFEFWYYRFYNGELDMDHDRSADRKSPELMQLPLEMVDKVMKNLRPADRLVTRNVSKTLQTIIDHQKIKIPRIWLDADNRRFPNYQVRLLFGRNSNWQKSIAYEKSYDGCTITSDEREKEFEVGNGICYALNDLKTLMKNPKLQMEALKLTVSHYMDLMDRTINALAEVSNSIKSQFHVNELYIISKNPDQIASCLSLLKPKVLEQIDINQYTEAITNTEQWQNAKIVKIHREVKFTAMEVENFRNFPEFEVYLIRFSQDDMVLLKDTLLTFPLFKKCKFGFDRIPEITIDNIALALGIGVQNQMVHVPIDGSNDVLEIRENKEWISLIYIEVERKQL